MWGNTSAILEKNPNEKLFINDKIINTKNDYELGVMNGDIGEIILHEKDTIVKINNKNITFNKKNIVWA